MILYGIKQSRRDIAERCGSLSQFAGVRLMTLADGVERGIRMLEFRTRSGLRFTVLVDRAMDISEVEHNGRAIGWHSPTGFRNPNLHDVEGENGLAWTRSFSGFLVTCGLNHILGPELICEESFASPNDALTRHSLHGRVSTIPARLTGYGERWESDRCILWAEGIVQQSVVFGENLHLHRRIEVDVGSNEIRLSDRVVNHGFLLTPHMFFYHVNIGYPVLDDGTRYLAPIREVVWASQSGGTARAKNVGYNCVPAPIEGFGEQVWQHEMTADSSGEVSVAVVNDKLAFGIEMTTRKDQFPCSYQWQYFQAGGYAMGIEPSTHHILGNKTARERGEMIWLGPLEERAYYTQFKVLTGPSEIAECEHKITAVAVQPPEPFPEPTGNFVALTAGRPQHLFFQGMQS